MGVYYSGSTSCHASAHNENLNTHCDMRQKSGHFTNTLTHTKIQMTDTNTCKAESKGKLSVSCQSVSCPVAHQIPIVIHLLVYICIFIGHIKCLRTCAYVYIDIYVYLYRKRQQHLSLSSRPPESILGNIIFSGLIHNGHTHDRENHNFLLAMPHEYCYVYMYVCYAFVMFAFNFNSMTPHWGCCPLITANMIVTYRQTTPPVIHIEIHTYVHIFACTSFNAVNHYSDHLNKNVQRKEIV